MEKEPVLGVEEGPEQEKESVRADLQQAERRLAGSGYSGPHSGARGPDEGGQRADARALKEKSKTARVRDRDEGEREERE